MRTFVIASLMQATRVAACYDEDGNKTHTDTPQEACDKSVNATMAAGATLKAAVVGKATAPPTSFLQVARTDGPCPASAKPGLLAKNGGTFQNKDYMQLWAEVQDHGGCADAVKKELKGYASAQADTIAKCCAVDGEKNGCVFNSVQKGTEGDEQQAVGKADVCKLYGCWITGKKAQNLDEYSTPAAFLQRGDTADENCDGRGITNDANAAKKLAGTDGGSDTTKQDAIAIAAAALCKKKD